jgi:hypothetical protein
MCCKSVEEDEAEPNTATLMQTNSPQSLASTSICAVDLSALVLPARSCRRTSSRVTAEAGDRHFIEVGHGPCWRWPPPSIVADHDAGAASRGTPYDRGDRGTRPFDRSGRGKARSGPQVPESGARNDTRRERRNRYRWVLVTAIEVVPRQCNTHPLQPLAFASRCHGPSHGGLCLRSVIAIDTHEVLFLPGNDLNAVNRNRFLRRSTGRSVEWAGVLCRIA